MSRLSTKNFEKAKMRKKGREKERNEIGIVVYKPNSGKNRNIRRYLDGLHHNMARFESLAPLYVVSPGLFPVFLSE